MDPADSVKVSRDSTYSGATQETDQFRVRGSHPLWPARSNAVPLSICFLTHEEWSYNPNRETRLVWALPISLAATFGIDLSFFSSGYLDVSVHRVPLHTLWIGVWIRGVCPRGFPHSDIRGSLDMCSFPRLFAAYHVFRRLSVPRHPPCALSSLTIKHHLRVRVITLMHSVAPLVVCLLYLILSVCLTYLSIRLGCLVS